jgi:hypothetical protein
MARVPESKPGFPMDQPPLDERSRWRRHGPRDRSIPRSNRFLAPAELAGPGRGRPPAGAMVFAEGHWPAIRVVLERQGWSSRQIELVQDQLRQGWPLDLAKEQVGRLTGHCPLHAQHPG